MEGQLIQCVFKVLVTRLVTDTKELKIQEDIVSTVLKSSKTVKFAIYILIYEK